MNPCTLCVFWRNERCTLTYRLHIHIEPSLEHGIGGVVEVETTPGMVPQELIPRVNGYFQKFLEKALVAISMFPVWGEVADWQEAHLPVTEACPGRNTLGKPDLRIVT